MLRRGAPWQAALAGISKTVGQAGGDGEEFQGVDWEGTGEGGGVRKTGECPAFSPLTDYVFFYVLLQRLMAMQLGQPIVWILLFEPTCATEVYLPVVPYVPTTPFLHMLDNDLVPVLEPLWWVLHLPAGFAQCYDINASKLVSLSELDVPHTVVLLPLGRRPAEMENAVPHSNIALIVCPDNSLVEAEQLAELFLPTFGIVRYSDLTQESLDNYWESIAKIVGDKGKRRLAPPLTLLGQNCAERLSSLHQARQFVPIDERPDSLPNHTQARLIVAALSLNRHIRTVGSLEVSGCHPEEYQFRYETEVKFHRPSWHLSIGAAGVPSVARRLAASAKNEPPPGVTTASI